MISIRPVPRALVPTDSSAAASVSGPNYDEFQGDDEIRELLRVHPDTVVRVTMAHCDDADSPGSLNEGSAEALERSAGNMRRLVDSSLTRTAKDVLWVYEISGPRRPGIRQLGLGGMGLTSEIRTPSNPGGSIIRNEGVREKKARGRADLIEATQAVIGTVSNAVDDEAGLFHDALMRTAEARVPDFEVVGEGDYKHRVWLVTDPTEQRVLQSILAEEPHAYVADGNHRSAAAAMLGYEDFLTLFFPTATMGIQPYNRLVKSEVPALEDVEGVLGASFEVRALDGSGAFQPTETHDVGLYTRGCWYALTPHASTFEPNNAVQVIDADIVQRKLFDEVWGISDPRDTRLRFVGSNRDAAYLSSEVDRGDYSSAVTLPAVTMRQFVDVCLQDRLMPPKSTWFEPKIRSGLVMALL